ncbi:MAG: copper resistance protein B [Steroidobacteraceae bacterium]
MRSAKRRGPLLRALYGALALVALSRALAQASAPEQAAPAAASEPTTAPIQMSDTDLYGTVLLDQLEWRNPDASNAAMWEAEGWYGGDYDKLWVTTEGERVGGETQDAFTELLWDHVVGRWWNLQTGVREDFGDGPSRTWAALGVEGLAPYGIDVEASVYAGEDGRTAARVRAEYDILLTQRLILQPQVEGNFYGKQDPARQVGSGLSDLDAGIRLRYEIRRELAPYIGVTWTRQADVNPARTFTEASYVQFVAGVRAWL